MSDFKWEVQKSPKRPDAVDYLAAIEDQNGEAATRIKEFEGHAAHFKRDREEMERLAAAPARQSFVIDLPTGGCVVSVITKKEPEDADSQGD